jgi:dipeptidase E
MVMAPISERTSSRGGPPPLGLVPFAMFPHLDHEELPENTMAHAEKWAAGMSVAGYAIDDDTAIEVTDGAVEIISEGNWRLFTPSPRANGSG